MWEYLPKEDKMYDISHLVALSHSELIVLTKETYSLVLLLCHLSPLCDSDR